MEARLTYAKAQQVHTTALNIATQYLAYRGAPNVYGITGGSLGKRRSRPGDRRVGDPRGPVRQHGLLLLRPLPVGAQPRGIPRRAARVRRRRRRPHTLDNPLDVLLARRPDLQHLGLSCENTNTALPYVDLVHEILEHWVVNGTLAGFEGHDTRPDAATADLLADPEFVVDAAYDTTKAAVYPSPLPFDAPLVHLRSLFEVWDTSLPAALDVLGAPADARREWLGLNAAELLAAHRRRFPRAAGVLRRAGRDDARRTQRVVGNAKTFSRRTDVTYVELADLLRRRSSTRVVLVPCSGAERAIGRSSSGSTARSPTRVHRLAAGRPRPGAVRRRRARVARHDRDLSWARSRSRTDAADDDSHECDFGLVELRHVLPDMTANRLTEIDHHRLLRFIRLWKKLGWSIAATDTAIAAFLGVDPATLTTATIDAAFAAMLDRLAGFLRLVARLDLSAKKRDQWLALFEPGLDPTVRQDRLAPLVKLGHGRPRHPARAVRHRPVRGRPGSADPSLPRLVDAAALLKGTKLKVADVDFLLRHADPTGKLTPTPAQVERDLSALRNALTAVDTELAVPAATADLGAAAARMALVYDAAVVDRFLALVAGTTTYAVPLVTAEEVLPAPLAAIAPGVRIDPFHNTLTSTGPLSAATRTALDTATAALTLADVEEITAPADLTAFKAALTAAFQGLQDAADADLDALDDEYPELKALYDTLVTLTDPAAQAAAIVVGILPELRRPCAAPRCAPRSRP